MSKLKCVEDEIGQTKIGIDSNVVPISLAEVEPFDSLNLSSSY